MKVSSDESRKGVGEREERKEVDNMETRPYYVHGYLFPVGRYRVPFPFSEFLVTARRGSAVGRDGVEGGSRLVRIIRCAAK